MKTKITKLLLGSMMLFFLVRCEKENLTAPPNPDLKMFTGTFSKPNIRWLKKLMRYRHYMYRDNIIYTTVARPNGLDGYEAIGDLGYVYTRKVSGTVPLYQYHDKLHTSDERYFYSTEYLATANNLYFDFKGLLFYYEGIVGYVYPSNISGTKPVYHYSWMIPSSAHPIFMYTLTNGARLPGYQGISFYVR